MLVEFVDAPNYYVIIQTLIVMLPRIAVMLWLFPFLDDSVFTRTIRTSFAFSIALIAFPAVFDQIPDQPFDVIILFGIFLKEVMIGAFFGFSVALLFWSVSTAGFILDMQRGAFTASLFSPVFKDQVSPIGGLLLQALTVMFFSTGAFLLCLKMVYASYTAWPVLTFYPTLSGGMADFVIDHFQTMIMTAMLIAAPMVIVMLLIDFSMGLINKFVPQLQVFFLSMPIKGVAAIFILILFAPRLIDYLEKSITVGLDSVLKQMVSLF